MKKILLLIPILLLVSIVGNAQKVVKSYQSVYVINTESAGRIALEHQLNRKTQEIRDFLEKYPVLDSMDKFNSRKRYSLINDALITNVTTSSNEKYTIYYLKTGVIYKVKNRKRIQKLL